MGQQIVGGKGPSACLPILGILCVAIVFGGLLLWAHWPR